MIDLAACFPVPRRACSLVVTFAAALAVATTVGCASVTASADEAPAFEANFPAASDDAPIQVAQAPVVPDALSYEMSVEEYVVEPPLTIVTKEETAFSDDALMTP